MKPWLLDILACPIDKHYPLKLYIFSFETKPEQFETFMDIYESRNLEQIKQEKIITYVKEGETLLIKDNIIIQKTPIGGYLKQIRASIEELDNIDDKTSISQSKKCLELILSKIKDDIGKFSYSNNLDEILPELYFLNKFKIETEIDSGLLFCDECNRWFPIIETIPQMLPDEYREEKKELQFLKTNKNLLNEAFFKLDLKPFNF